MASKKKFQLNDKKPIKNVNNALVANSTRDSVWFDFRNKDWLKSIKYKDFTNFLNDSHQYIEHQFYLFHTLIPKIIEEWRVIIAGGRQFQHCHRLTGEKKELVKRVCEEIFNYRLGEEVDLWQFGFTGSVRLVCINHGAENALIPVFVDYHHLIEPSVKYNQNDYKNYTYCPVCDFIHKKY